MAYPVYPLLPWPHFVYFPHFRPRTSIFYLSTCLPTNKPTFERIPADYAPCSPVTWPTRTALRRACAIELASMAVDKCGLCLEIQ